MQFMPRREIFLNLFGVEIYWYGFLILIGILIASAISIHNLKKYNISSDDFIDIAVPTMIMAIIGARLWYVVFEWDLYKDNLINIIKINNGGLAIQGGVILGLITAIYMLKKKKISILIAGDCIMPNVLLAQAIGRWGNFANQEAHGGKCSLNFLESLHLPQFIIDGMYINNTYWHPTFLYESILNIIGFLIIIFIIKKLFKTQGVQFGSYFIWYGFIRFFVEALRTDSLMFLGLKTAQLTSIIFIIFGIILITISKKQTPRTIYNFLK